MNMKIFVRQGLRFIALIWRRRLESLTICWCSYKGSPFSSVISPQPFFFRISGAFMGSKLLRDLVFTLILGTLILTLKLPDKIIYTWFVVRLILKIRFWSHQEFITAITESLFKAKWLIPQNRIIFKRKAWLINGKWHFKHPRNSFKLLWLFGMHAFIWCTHSSIQIKKKSC